MNVFQRMISGWNNVQLDIEALKERRYNAKMQSLARAIAREEQLVVLSEQKSKLQELRERKGPSGALKFGRATVDFFTKPLDKDSNELPIPIPMRVRNPRVKQDNRPMGALENIDMGKIL